MEVLKFRLWVFYFLAICKGLSLTNKNIYSNLSLESKRFSRASTGYFVCSQIDSLKVNCKLLNKRKPTHSYRENPPKKLDLLRGISKSSFREECLSVDLVFAPLSDISEPSFKVKFLFPNTPSPEVGGLREWNFIIINNVNHFWDTKA